jgi:hypothetical protein
MNISPSEAEEALSLIQAMMKKTRKSISASGSYKFLVLWGIIWLLGFFNSQFLSEDLSPYIWMGLNVIGGIASMIIGIRLNLNVRSEKSNDLGKRIGVFWALLFVFCFITITIIFPINGKQIAMVIIVFVTTGWVAMGLLLSFASVRWGLALIGLAIIAYFLFPAIFYLLMGVVGGGGMVLLGLYIRNRW